MGTRALRKLREQEWEKQLAASHDEEEPEVEDDEEEPVVVSKPKNAFDMLNDADDDDDNEDDDDEEEHPEEPSAQVIPTQPIPAQSSTPKSSKKKKKKPKKKQRDATGTPQQAESKEVSEDEIDKALKELSLKQPVVEGGENDTSAVEWERNATKDLAIEARSLDPVNEMRGLFGNIALEDDSRRSQPTRRREQNMQGGVDLHTALTGRYNRASQGKELGALAKRRNCFMQGKEEWPLATSGGLSMEALPVTTFAKHYNILHNQLYKSADWDFKMAVESMQAEAIIALLQKYPYHVTTLLQVSEIAKHQGDSSLSGDLLERALFTLGRSVHSSFPQAIREGTARLSFDKPANRELFLTIWRYIRNLEQRGTWKTAYEWSKLLLQFNTTSDPFGVTLMIDQLALRGRQHEQFLQLISDSSYGNTWAHLPNICISKTLALLRAQKPREARQQLALAIHRYPYILSALASALEVAPVPKSLWGKLPSSDAEKLHTELYVTRAKDLWNTPETIGLISEVANTAQHYKSFVDQHPQAPKLDISLEEARHVMALEIPNLIHCLPRQFTNMPTSMSDVLPPPSSEASDLTQRAPATGTGTGTRGGQGLVAVGGDLVQRALEWFYRPVDRANMQGSDTAHPPAENLAALREELGPEARDIPDEVLQQMMEMHIAADMGDDAEALAGGPMAGGWDYYEDAANAASDDDYDGQDSDAMPDLEEIPGASGEILDEDQEPTRDPHAATVEEADSDDETRPARPAPSSGALLRHADSDDEEVVPTSVRLGPQAPTTTPVTGPSMSTVPEEDVESNPQRLQRWLITTGLDEIKASGNLSTYVKRLKMLHKNQQGWILNVVKQRGSGDLAGRIESAL